jgi:hypothetical protein
MKTTLLTIFTFFIFVSANGAIKTWDGGGGDSNFATAANWVGDVAPIANDDLVFPLGALIPTLNNNYSASTVFRSITFEGDNYAITGNNLNITNGITTNGGSQTITAPITLSGISQTLSHNSSTDTTYASISIGTTNLTVFGTGSSVINNLNGSGQITKESNGSCNLNNSVNFQGSFILNRGNLTLNTDTPNADLVNNGGILNGSGAIGKLTNNSGIINLTRGGFIIIVPSINQPNLNIDDLTLDTKDVILSSTSQFALSIGSFFTNQVEYSQLNVIGTVLINNAFISSLGLRGNNVPVGIPYTIINNDGTEPVSGIFANRPEGSTFFSRGSLYKISYIGGTGNDVTLTRLNIAPFDFDGDGKTDIATYKPSNGLWSIKQSSNNIVKIVNFGLGTDLLTPADYDGDFKTDIAVFRPSNGVWYNLSSINGAFSAAQFGINGDVPVPNDYNGDGKADIAVFRQGLWYLNGSQNTPIRIEQFGLSGDKPVPNDYLGFGSAAIGVFRPSTSRWYYYVPNFSFTFDQIIIFGISTDVPVPADYDGDRLADYAVFRASNSGGVPDFYILQSSTGTIRYVEFGSIGDIPQTGDFDGDGKIDVAVYRPSNNTWYLLQSTNGFDATTFGQTGDKPVSSAYIN